MQPPDPPRRPPSPSLWRNIDKSQLPPLLRNLPESEPPPVMDRFPDDEIASHGGHGTLEALEVSRLLEKENIPACMCGVSALIYYGAQRGRLDWEICVPSSKFTQAETLLKSPAHSPLYMPIPPWPYQQHGSLQHIYPRFKRIGIAFSFVLIPDWDAHFNCSSASSIRRSSNGLPYPTLPVFMQSFIDTNDQNALCDLVDGTDVTEAWGAANLDLDGGTDLEWAKRKNEMIDEANGGVKYTAMGVPTQDIGRRELWELVVRNKGARRGFKKPEGQFATQYRLHGSPDPWLEDRICS